jgi:putative hydrolases of HD superfamily
MSTPHTPRPLADFAYEVGRLRFINRDFYIDGVNRPANVAEHSYRVSLLAWLIAEGEGADVGEVLKMAIIHDLPEVRTLDHGIISSQYNAVHEERAAEDLLKPTLPQALEAFHKYEQRLSKEAKIVKDADRLDVVLECKELKCRGFDYPAIWNEELTAYRDLLTTQTARQMFDDIQASHPMDFTVPMNRQKLEKLKQNQNHKLKVA